MVFTVSLSWGTVRERMTVDRLLCPHSAKLAIGLLRRCVIRFATCIRSRGLAVRILLISACQRPASLSARYGSSTAKSAPTAGSFSAAILGGCSCDSHATLSAAWLIPRFVRNSDPERPTEARASGRSRLTFPPARFTSCASYSSTRSARSTPGRALIESEKRTWGDKGRPEPPPYPPTAQGSLQAGMPRRSRGRVGQVVPARRTMVASAV
jgi:hypothetical protein